MNVMLDLEAMGRSPDAAITAIGAVAFDPVAGLVGDKFYCIVDLISAVDAGGKIDAATVIWWLKQSDAARAEICREGISIKRALTEFRDWLRTLAERDEIRVWGNGVAFDNVILAGAYHRSDIRLPWHPKNDRDYRTLRALRPDIELARVGTHHNAVDDAESQAQHLIDIWRTL